MWRDLKYFFLISRPLNVLISVLTFGVACFLASHRSLGFMADAPFWATALIIAVIAATGYWVNDVYDFRIDRINRPGNTIVNAQLSVKKVLTVYFIVNVLILLFSLGYLGFGHGYYHMSFINLLSVALLFVYASYLKRIGGAGNLLIAFLIALVLILAYYLYESLPLSLVWAIVFAFQITFIREITKDVQDIKGDLAFGLKTLPIQIGVSGTKRVLLVLYFLFLLSTYLPVIVSWWRGTDWLWEYMTLSVLLVQIPCIYLVRMMWRSEEPSHFAMQSNMLKVLMLTGMVTLFFL